MAADIVTTKELTSVLFEFVKFTNTFWGVYATVTIALLGWVFSSEKEWGKTQKFSLSTAYALIATINCLAQIRFSNLISATLLDLSALLAKKEGVSNLRIEIENIPTIPVPLLILIYLIITSVVIYLTMSHNNYIPKKHNSGDS